MPYLELAVIVHVSRKVVIISNTESKLSLWLAITCFESLYGWMESFQLKIRPNHV